MKKIYFDNASTTPVDPRVLEVMLPFFTENYGNPESRHHLGKLAKIEVDNAREEIAKILNCRASEITFCGSATEANNLAILGYARNNKNKGKHLITSKIEHSSILEPFRQLEKEGFDITYLNVDKDGFVNPNDLKEAINDNTILVSIIYANNEIGTIEPISKLGEICATKNIIFHTDACQAAGAKSLDTKELNADMLTINGSKIYGPKGVGVLYVKREIDLEPIAFGGGQENGLRSGTQNVANIVGMGKALKIADEEREKNNQHLITLRDFLISELLKIPNTRLNGSRTIRLPNNINITFTGIDAQRLILTLDDKGIYISAGSACNAGKGTPSKVLKSIELSDEEMTGTIRITLGKNTTAEDIQYTIDTFKEIIENFTS